MIYRILQFAHAISSHLDPLEVKWALKHLSPKASILFLQQSPADQRHAIDVTKSIMKEKHPILIEDFKNLITAALLHDCGKSIIYIHLWERVFIVLINLTPQPLRSRLERGLSRFSFPLKVDTRHALWGSYLAKQAGLNPEVCQLIRDHHKPTTNLGLLLKHADNKH